MTHPDSAAGSPLTFEDKLQNYARLAVQVGLGIRPGQRVLVQAPVDTAPLARLLVREAYAAGASFVDVRWDDDDVVLARFELAPEGTFDTISQWRVNAETEVAGAGGAVIAIRAANPGLLANVDAARVTTHARALAAYRKPYTAQVMTNRLNWNLISAPVAGWAQVMFPDATAQEAIAQQWDAIFAATRADQPDPVALWQTHLADLKRRRDTLTAKQYHALHFKSGETDLTVGLADGHIWGGGSADTPGGITFTANIPTEEVWTAPHRNRVDGVVVSTKPLSYNGVLVDGIRIRFEGGRVVEATAEKGQDALTQMIATDEGSHRLGEVALVPHSSPDQPLRAVLLQHPVRRKRRLAYRHRHRLPFQCGWRRGHEPGRLSGNRRQRQPRPCRLDDRQPGYGCGRPQRVGRAGSGDAGGRIRDLKPVSGL